MYTTAQDFADDLSDVINHAADRLGQLDVRRALLQAYHNLHTKRDWTVYQRFLRIMLSAPYLTGTVAYDHTGGAVERQLTLTGGTWPDWSPDGTLRIGIERYTVQARVSGTVLQLDPLENPGQDVASTAYTLTRDRYPLPADYQKSGQWTTFDGRILTYVSLVEWLAYQAVGGTIQGGPFRYTLLGDPHRPSGLLALFDPSPGAVTAVSLNYQRIPRPVQVIAYEAGKAALAAASPTVTGSGTAFTSAMTGSIFRLSADPKSAPTGIAGANPASFESVILSINSPSSLTLTDDSPVSVNAGTYRISDPLDYEAGPMTEALFKMGAMYLLAKRRDIKSNRNAMVEFQEAFDTARAADCRVNGPQTLTGRTATW